jgi:hypothetical protein
MANLLLAEAITAGQALAPYLAPAAAAYKYLPSFARKEIADYGTALGRNLTKSAIHYLPHHTPPSTGSARSISYPALSSYVRYRRPFYRSFKRYNRYARRRYYNRKRRNFYKYRYQNVTNSTYRRSRRRTYP